MEDNRGCVFNWGSFFGSIDYREDCVRNLGKNILVGISLPVTIPIVLILVGLGKAERVECR